MKCERRDKRIEGRQRPAFAIESANQRSPSEHRTDVERQDSAVKANEQILVEPLPQGISFF